MLLNLVVILGALIVCIVHVYVVKIADANKTLMTIVRDELIDMTAYILHLSFHKFYFSDTALDTTVLGFAAEVLSLVCS